MAHYKRLVLYYLPIEKPLDTERCLTYAIILGKHPVEAAIVRIAQLGRAAGVHLIVATQQPTVKVVTSLIKANIPCRIALKTATVSNSMVVLDTKGAEKLTGRGDALLKLPDRVTPIRFQVPLIETPDIIPVMKYWGKQ